MGGSCRLSKGWAGLGEPVKSMPNPSAERAVIDRAMMLEQETGAISSALEISPAAAAYRLMQGWRNTPLIVARPIARWPWLVRRRTPQRS